MKTKLLFYPPNQTPAQIEENIAAVITQYEEEENEVEVLGFTMTSLIVPGGPPQIVRGNSSPQQELIAVQSFAVLLGIYDDEDGDATSSDLPREVMVQS